MYGTLGRNKCQRWVCRNGSISKSVNFSNSNIKCIYKMTTFSIALSVVSKRRKFGLDIQLHEEHGNQMVQHIVVDQIIWKLRSSIACSPAASALVAEHAAPELEVLQKMNVLIYSYPSWIWTGSRRPNAQQCAKPYFILTK